MLKTNFLLFYQRGILFPNLIQVNQKLFYKSEKAGLCSV